MADSDKVQADVSIGDIILATHINTIIDNILANLPRFAKGRTSRTNAAGLGLQTIYSGFTPKGVNFTGAGTTSPPSGTGTDESIGKGSIAIIDLFNYADNTAIQAAYAESGTATLITQVASGGIASDGHANLTFTSGTAIVTASSLITYDLRRDTGVDTGVPSKGYAYLSVRKPANNVSSVTMKIGSSSGDYLSVTQSVPATTATWLPLKFDLTGGSQTGTVDWENITYLSIEFTTSGTGNVDFDSCILVNQVIQTNGYQSFDDKIIKIDRSGSHDAELVAVGEKNVVIDWISIPGVSFTSYLLYEFTN